MTNQKPSGLPEFRHPVRVRYGETDQMGICHHANYLAYFEEARTRMMAAMGCPYETVEASGIGLAVRKAELRYRAPAHFDEELEVLVLVTGLRGASVTFGYEIRRPLDGAIIVTGSTELACIGLASGDRRPKSLPEDLARLLGA